MDTRDNTHLDDSELHRLEARRGKQHVAELEEVQLKHMANPPGQKITGSKGGGGARRNAAATAAATHENGDKCAQIGHTRTGDMVSRIRTWSTSTRWISASGITPTREQDRWHGSGGRLHGVSTQRRVHEGKCTETRTAHSRQSRHDGEHGGLGHASAKGQQVWGVSQRGAGTDRLQVATRTRSQRCGRCSSAREESA